MLPLTLAQRWLFHVRAGAMEQAIPVQRVYRISQAVSAVALQRAVSRLVERHEALRLRLDMSGAEPRQYFPPQEPELEVLSITGGTLDDRERYARARFVSSAARALDLTRELPLQIQLAVVDVDRCLLALTVDHLAADEAGFDLLETELAILYGAAMNGTGEGTALEATRGLFEAYVRDDAAQIEDTERNLRYWEQHLSGAPLVNNDNESAWVDGIAWNESLGSTDLTQLRLRCRHHRVSLFVGVLAAQASLLAGLGSSADLVINVPISNRVQHDERWMIANLASLVHIRLNLRDWMPSGELLRMVRTSVLEAVAHRRYDYAQLGSLLAAETRVRGGRLQWRVGCSHLVVPGPVLAPVLPLERVAMVPADGPTVPPGTFSLSCRESPAELTLNAVWDAETWGTDPQTIGSRLLRLLEETTQE
ncbi:MAG: condensation domain-containing protein [Gemmatimonadales bacterium]